MTVEICDVGPRDGLQTEAKVVAPEVRAELCRRLLGAGLAGVEAVSFVRDDLVPAMAGAEQVFAGLDADARRRCSALVLNRRGLERAMAAGVEQLHFVVAAGDEFARRNQGAAAEQVVRTAEAMLAESRRRGVGGTRAVIAVAFGCPFEGDVDPGTVVETAARLAAAGVDELAVADTIGVAAPREVAALCGRLLELGRPVGFHPHDTRNTGAANAWSALEAGATFVESSVGGLGGCPFAPGATGNLATEDLVYLLERAGVATGVDLDRLCEIVTWLESVLRRRLPGKLAQVGAPPADRSAQPVG